MQNIEVGEPTESFPYLPPSEMLCSRYKSIFELESPIKIRWSKRLFDIVFSALILVLVSPVLAAVWLGYKIEGMLVPENAGPVFFNYTAVSGAKQFPKYKIRIIKQSCVDAKLAKSHDWHAYKNEWNPACRTYVGRFVKKYYLDELPQFYSVLIGDMSIVGPRPLAVHHYQRDFDQGNVSRMVIKGGILGLGHIRKGTGEMGDPKFEYEYVDKSIHFGALALFRLDLWIIWRGLCVVVKGKGL